MKRSTKWRSSYRRSSHSITRSLFRRSASAVKEFEIAISLLARKEFDVGALTSDILPLDSFAEAFRRLNDGSAVKILMRPGE